LNENPTPTASSRWYWRIVALGVLAAGIAGFVALNVLKPRPAVRAPAKQLPLVRVEPVQFRSGALAVTGNGLVKPRIEVVLAAEVSGRLVFVSPNLVTGGAFEANEPLLRIDPEPFRAALAQASAERRSAQASLRLAEQLLERTRELIAKGFLSRQTLDERIAARDQALAALARAEAIEHSRQLDLERSVVAAPFEGRVLSEKVDLGDTVQPGKELARIYAADALEIPVSLTDRDIALIADPWARQSGGRGARAEARVEYGGVLYRWTAHVDRVESAVDSGTRTFNVVVAIDAPAARGEALGTGPQAAPPGGVADAAPPLLVGMYATVEIEGRREGRYAVVPRRALRDGSTLWLVGTDDRVSIRPVRLLNETENRAVVSADGLPEQARVIVSDLKIVTQDMPVRVVEAPTTGSPPVQTRAAADARADRSRQ
jgi:RND family efflux transporter MFP subunit